MNLFRDIVRQEDFVVTAQLPLQPTTTVADIEDAASTLIDVVDAVQVIDDRDAVGHMSPLAAAAIVLRNGLDAIIHLTGRDRNRVALQAELLGAAALGATSLVLQRGEKLSMKDGLRGKGVFDTRDVRLTEMARRLGDESKLVSAPGFLLGTYVTIFGPADDWQAQRISESLRAGTRLLMTQPCLNAALLRRYMAKLIELKVLHTATLLVEIPLLTSRDVASTYKTRNPGALVPDTSIARIVNADDPRTEAIAVCAEMLGELSSTPGVSGVNIRHGDDVADVRAVCDAATLAGSN